MVQNFNSFHAINKLQQIYESLVVIFDYFVSLKLELIEYSCENLQEPAYLI